jgi:hypothetical protein
MNKLNSLLKKVEFFEKLALYGDRKEFLKALATNGGDAGTPDASAGSVQKPIFTPSELEQIEKNDGQKAVEDKYSTEPISYTPNASSEVSIISEKPQVTLLDNAKFFLNKLTKMNPETNYANMAKIVYDMKIKLLPLLEKQNPQAAQQMKQQFLTQETRLNEYVKEKNKLPIPSQNEISNPYV